MTGVSNLFISESRAYLLTHYFATIERSLLKLSDEQIWWRPNEASNSIGNLILHLTGNVRQWIMGGVGRTVVERVRQQEFDERSLIPGSRLLQDLRETLAVADDVIQSLSEEDLLEVRSIQNREVTVFQAIYHVVEHFSTHTGQIVSMTKAQGA
jgi:uncharacterized damage-inducible protein DinB